MATNGHTHEAERLSPACERELVRAAIAKDPGACQRLIEAFMPLIGSQARHYRNTAVVQHEELMQEGVVGLLRALRRFDPDRGTPFWGYASFWVRQAMQELVSQLTRPAVLSDRALRRLARVKEARRRWLQAHRREPTSTELAQAIHCTREQIESLLAIERAPRGLEEPVAEDGDTFGDLLADPVAEDPYSRVIDQILIDEVHALASELDERECNIVYAHYGVGRPAQTLRQIGGRFGLSVERIRQIEEHALDKLRAAAAASPS
jgi:RNA polymerase sigma factor (sigma-70 family)